MSQVNAHINESAIKDLRSKISSIRFGMLTTINTDQTLSSRPMTQQELDDNGVVWFFVSDTSEVAADIGQDSHINVTFANPTDSIYVSVSGNAQVIKDKEKTVELWNPAVAAWFPDGVDDPHLSLIKLDIDNAEYWDSHTNKMMKIFAIAKAAIVGEKPENIGQHQKIDFN